MNASSPCLFVVVAGTDTGVGKTWVAAALGRELARRGRRVIAVKPVESGCGAETVATEDGAVLAEATGQSSPRSALLRLGLAVAPPVAADAEGVEIDLDALVANVRVMADGSDVVIVEGAGGLCSPLSWQGDLLDVARALDARVLVVGSDRLGVVNHVVLTMHSILACWLAPLGVVLTPPEVADASTGTNSGTLGRILGGRETGGEYDRIASVPRVDWREAGSAMTELITWVEGELGAIRAEPARTTE
jgi:dethiobiotin synthetase